MRPKADRQSDLCHLEGGHTDLSEGPLFQKWLKRTKHLIQTRCGPDLRLRMYGYEQGTQSIIALDVFSKKSCNDLAITIFLSPGRATLADPVDDQLDISLPSILTVLDFANLILRDQGQPAHLGHHLEISPWCKPPLKQPATNCDRFPEASLSQLTKEDSPCFRSNHTQ